MINTSEMICLLGEIKRSTKDVDATKREMNHLPQKIIFAENRYAKLN